MRHTLELKCELSGSMENLPGSSTKVCCWLCMMTVLPYWTRLTLIGDGIMWTYVLANELNSGKVLILTVKFIWYSPYCNVFDGI